MLGWRNICAIVGNAGFSIVAAHPVKAKMASFPVDAVRNLLDGVFSENRMVVIQPPQEWVGNDEKMGQLPL